MPLNKMHTQLFTISKFHCSGDDLGGDDKYIEEKNCTKCESICESIFNEVVMHCMQNTS